MLSKIPANLKENRSKTLHTFHWECIKVPYHLQKVEWKQMLRKRAALIDPSVGNCNLSWLTLKTFKVLRCLRNLLVNPLPWSLICYSGDNRRAATLWSTFHRTSREGFAFLYPHPLLLFIC